LVLSSDEVLQPAHVAPTLTGRSPAYRITINWASQAIPQQLPLETPNSVSMEAEQ
jgi:hypothetical protein